MERCCCLAALLLVAASCAVDDDSSPAAITGLEGPGPMFSKIEGTWQGTFEYEGWPYRVEFLIAEEDAHSFSGTANRRDSGIINEGLQGTRHGGGRISGRLTAGGLEFDGHVTGHTMELVVDAPGEPLAITLVRDNPAFAIYRHARLDAQGVPITEYSYTPPEPGPDGWPVATLSAQDINEPLTKIALELILGDNTPQLDGLYVFRNGKKVLAETFYGNDAHRPRPIASITKSVTSLIVGQAIDRQLLPPLDSLDSVLASTYFADDYGNSAWVDDGYAITLHDLLSMTAALDWFEPSDYTDPLNDAVKMIRAKDPIGYVLNQPPATHGSPVFTYNSGLSFLLGRVVDEALEASGSDDRIKDVADLHLFAPLGITDYRFAHVGDTAHTGGGMAFTGGDLAKIGELVRLEGVWQGQQLVSPEWIAASTSPQGSGGYGYQWWLETYSNGMTVISGRGYGNNYLHIVPELDLVIVVNARDYEGLGPVPVVTFLLTVAAALGADAPLERSDLARIAFELDSELVLH